MFSRASRFAAANNRTPKKAGLDTLRAFAISWVLLYHATIFDLIPEGNRFIDAGWMGVDLFFALSGYLIGGQIFRPLSRGEIVSYRAFFARRALRTLPAYFVVLAVYFLLPQIREGLSIQPLWQFVTFTENIFVTTEIPKAFSHVWSLCVEEQFYVLMPIAVLLLAPRASQRLIAGVVIGIIGFGVALRAWAWLSGVSAIPFDVAGEPDQDKYLHLIYYPTWTRLDGILAGVVVALVQTFRTEMWSRVADRANLALAAGLCGVLVSMAVFEQQTVGFWAATFGYPLIAASMALLVAGGSFDTSFLGKLRIPGAGALAAGAYSLYLSHKLVFKSVKMGWTPALYAGSTGKITTALIVAGFIGLALYALVERPFLSLRDRWFGRSRSSLAEPS